MEGDSTMVLSWLEGGCLHRQEDLGKAACRVLFSCLASRSLTDSLARFGMVCGDVKTWSSAYPPDPNIVRMLDLPPFVGVLTVQPET